MNASAKVGGSSFVINKGPAHPLTARIAEVMAKMAANGLDARKAKLIAMKHRNGGNSCPGLPDGEYLVSKLSPEHREQMYEMIRAFRFGADDLKSSGTFDKINPMEVYGRVDTSEPIHDVGCGKGFRMLTGGHRVTGYEIDLSKVAKQNQQKVKHIDCFDPPDHETVTSLNALTQKTLDVSLVEGRHGLHVFPDLDYLLRAGLARQDDDGTIVGKDHLGVERWRDKYYVGGSPIMDGYRAISWFRKVKIDLRPIGRIARPEGGLKSVGKRVVGSAGAFTGCEVSYKYDGEHYRIHVSRGTGHMIGEGETGIVAEASDPNAVLSLELERMPDGRFILIQVHQFLNITPPHTLDTVEKAAMALELSLGGVPLEICPPERADIAGLGRMLRCGTADGLVFKHEGTDYLVKDRQSVDVHVDCNRDDYVAAAEKAGFRVIGFDRIPGRPAPSAVAEFIIEMTGPDVYLRFKRMREKTKTDDPEQFAAMLSWPTTKDFSQPKAPQNMMGGNGPGRATEFGLD